MAQCDLLASRRIKFPNQIQRARIIHKARGQKIASLDFPPDELAERTKHFGIFTASRCTPTVYCRTDLQADSPSAATKEIIMQRILTKAAQNTAKMFRWFIISMLSLMFFAPLILAINSEI